MPKYQFLKNKQEQLVLPVLLAALLLSAPLAAQKANVPTASGPASAQTVPAPAPAVKTKSGFSLFNLKLPKIKLPSLANKKQNVKYRLCAKRRGVCKCHKVGDDPGTFVTMDPSHCTPPPPPVIEMQLLEEKKDIKEVQKLLKQLGFKPGPADGAVGKRTKNAILLYQDRENLDTPSGVSSEGLPTVALLDRLHEQTAQKAIAQAQAEAAKKSGQKTGLGSAASPNIKLVQEKLNTLGYDAGKADGTTGPKTIAAIKRFQKATALPEDGKISDSLIKKLAEMAPDDVSQPVYAGTPVTDTTAQTASPPASAASSGPLGKLLGGLKKGMGSTLPTSAKGFRSCALRDGKCLCQKISDDPGVWTTMAASVCANPATAGKQSALKATGGQPTAAITAKATDQPTLALKKVATAQNMAAPAKSDSFFDSISKALTPGK